VIGRYEQKHTRPISNRRFVLRMIRHVVAALAMGLGSVGVGMAGYEHYESLPWRDAFLNSAMLLGGMGPVNAPQTPHGKVFAGLYALYAGLVFIVAASVIFAPIVHRVIHHFHWASAQGPDDAQ